MLTYIRIKDLFISDNEKLSFIKNECKKLNIQYINELDISIKDLNIINDAININNKYIDDLLKDTIWKRNNNYFNSQNPIELTCLKCNKSTINILYKILIKKLNNNNIPKCKNCYCFSKYVRLNKILIINNFVAIDKYLNNITEIRIKCIKCNYIKKIIPRNIFDSKKKIIKCEMCIN